MQEVACNGCSRAYRTNLSLYSVHSDSEGSLRIFVNLIAQQRTPVLTLFAVTELATRPLLVARQSQLNVAQAFQSN